MGDGRPFDSAQGKPMNVKAMDVEAHRDLRMLEAVHEDSRVTQRSLAVGSQNVDRMVGRWIEGCRGPLRLLERRNDRFWKCSQQLLCKRRIGLGLFHDDGEQTG